MSNNDMWQTLFFAHLFDLYNSQRLQSAAWENGPYLPLTPNSSVCCEVFLLEIENDRVKICLKFEKTWLWHEKSTIEIPIEYSNCGPKFTTNYVYRQYFRCLMKKNHLLHSPWWKHSHINFGKLFWNDSTVFHFSFFQVARSFVTNLSIKPKNFVNLLLSMHQMYEWFTYFLVCHSFILISFYCLINLNFYIHHFYQTIFDYRNFLEIKCQTWTKNALPLILFVAIA